jgi:hypothetical protein
MFNCFLPLFVSVEVSDAYVNVLSIIVFSSINFIFVDMFLFLKKIFVSPDTYMLGVEVFKICIF